MNRAHDPHLAAQRFSYHERAGVTDAGPETCGLDDLRSSARPAVVLPQPPARASVIQPAAPAAPASSEARARSATMLVIAHAGKAGAAVLTSARSGTRLAERAAGDMSSDRGARQGVVVELGGSVIAGPHVRSAGLRNRTSLPSGVLMSKTSIQ
jgi:hypothetical protein